MTTSPNREGSSLDAETAGVLLWHSSEEGGGPDVGVSLGLGDGHMLWLGEITRNMHAEHGLPGHNDGWWLIHYASGKPGEPLARVLDGQNYAARNLLDRVACGLRKAHAQPSTSAGPAEAARKKLAAEWSAWIDKLNGDDAVSLAEAIDFVNFANTHGRTIQAALASPTGEGGLVWRPLGDRAESEVGRVGDVDVGQVSQHINGFCYWLEAWVRGPGHGARARTVPTLDEARRAVEAAFGAWLSRAGLEVMGSVETAPLSGDMRELLDDLQNDSLGDRELGSILHPHRRTLAACIKAVAQAQGVLAAHLPPDSGIDAKEAVTRLLGVLDDRRLVGAMSGLEVRGASDRLRFETAIHDAALRWVNGHERREELKAILDAEDMDWLVRSISGAIRPDGLAALSPEPQGSREGWTLADLRAANEARQAEWCPDQVPDLSFRGNELGGECGEAQNVIKKLERERQGWRGSRATLDDLAQELADVVICADLCAMTAGVDLYEAVRAKFNATSEKVGLATRLTPSPPPSLGGKQGASPDGEIARLRQEADDWREMWRRKFDEADALRAQLAEARTRGACPDGDRAGQQSPSPAVSAASGGDHPIARGEA